MTAFVDSVLRGFFSPIEGGRILFSSPRAMAFALLPVGLGVFLMLSGFYWGGELVRNFLGLDYQNWNWPESWPWLASFIGFFVGIIMWLVISLFNFIFAYLLIVLLGGPFYALMVENVYSTHWPEFQQQKGLGLFARMIFLGLIKVFVFCLVGLFCFILSFFPLVNIFSTLLVFAMVAFDCSDYAFEVDALSLRERFGFFRRHSGEYLGLSLAILCTSLVPGSFFILLPAFICGATKMYIQLRRQSV